VVLYLHETGLPQLRPLLFLNVQQSAALRAKCVQVTVTAPVRIQPRKGAIAAIAALGVSHL
jgi:hypothetical protein